MSYPSADYIKLDLGLGVLLCDTVDNQAPFSIYTRLTVAAF